jgi:hypothetical protein
MSNAQVNLKVVNFRAMHSLTNPEFVEATTALAEHDDSVSLVDRSGMPTLRVKRPVDIEIHLASADPKESYKPLALYFRQETDPNTKRKDPEGRTNFTTSLTPKGTVVMRHNCLLRGPDGRYEFYVLIQRASDGAVGLIDPGVETEEE